MTTTAQPFPKSEMARLPFIDSLRGFALLGSLLMNIIGSLSLSLSLFLFLFLFLSRSLVF